MKRLLIILLSFIPVCAMQAQTKAEKIEDIRQQYALAKEKVSKNGKKNPNKQLELVLYNKDDDGSPAYKEVVNIYFEEILDYVEPNMPLRGEGAYFMTRKFTRGDIDIYQEWLFDLEDLGKPIFAYQCQKQNNGTKLESRYYWSGNQLIEVKTNDPDADREGIENLRYAHEYIEVFNKIANRNWE